MLPKRILSERLPPVTRLAFGSLTVGPLQTNLPVEEAADVLAYAFDRGINFVDTAQYYINYPIIRRALELCSSPGDVIVSTKTYAYSREGAIEAVEEARWELNRDVIDIFMLHEQESIHTLHGHMDALQYLLEQREKGVVRAVGVSCHHVSCVEGVLELLQKEGIRLDVIHPLYNKAGIGIADGGEADMARVLPLAHDSGIGIFAMKALAGGHLCATASEALSFVLEKPFIDACAVGMQSHAEVDANIEFFSEGNFSDEALHALGEKKRVLHIEDYCEGCGACVKRCPQGALFLTDITVEAETNPYDFSSDFAAQTKETERKTVRYAAVDHSKCVLCAYCTAVCPLFALKVY
ncbi:MAG: 4Fe-4S dicluster domain-containing protein [Ruminococcaceae bacterium]|nr:4Fe-4S dicluster domain-containing protein [Oscillospiraceae bacterium]